MGGVADGKQLSNFAFAVPVLGVFDHSLGEEILLASLRGVSQVFLIDNAATGALILFGVALYSRIAAVAALLGSFLALGVGFGLGVSRAEIFSGLMGYNSVLTAVAATVFISPFPLAPTFVFSLVAVIFAALLHSALEQALSDPQVTLAFNVATLTLLWSGLGRIGSVQQPEEHIRILLACRRHFKKPPSYAKY